MRSGIVTLVTDYGTADGYAGALKGAIASASSKPRVVDVSHEIPPGDVLAGAWCLKVSAPCFPPGTVHLAVVDPGVGGSRRPVVIARGGSLLVGPDNGLLSMVPGEDSGAWEIDVAAVAAGRVPPTFHGRDVFAPAAARMAAGLDPAAIGRPIDLAGLARLPLDTGWSEEGGFVAGRVVHVDRFGNLVTSIPSAILARCSGKGDVAGRPVPACASCYEAIPPGEVALVEGSQGLVEVSAHGESAARILGVAVGAEVGIRLRGGGAKP